MLFDVKFFNRWPLMGISIVSNTGILYLVGLFFERFDKVLRYVILFDKFFSVGIEFREDWFR